MQAAVDPTGCGGLWNPMLLTLGHPWVALIHMILLILPAPPCTTTPG